MEQVPPARVFPALGAVVLLVVCAVVALVLLIDAAVRSGPGNALLLAPWPLLVLWGAYIVGVASDVRANREGVRVQNLLRRTWVPWSRITRIAMRWQLELTLDDGSVVRCLGSPAHSRPRRLRPGRVPEDSAPEAEDGLARLHRLRSEAQTPAGARVVRTWDLPALLALGVIVAWAIAAVALTR